MTKRSLLQCIILSIVTCGIYAIYWFYKLVQETNEMTKPAEPKEPGMVIVLTLVTCGIYQMYWLYLLGERLDAMDVQAGRQGQNRALLYLILAITGFGIADYAFIQYEINKRVDAGGYSANMI